MCVSNFRHLGGDVELGERKAFAVVAIPAEVAGDENRVDVRTAEHGVEDRDERGDVLLARSCEVDGVGDACRRRQHLSQGGADLGGELRHRKSGGLDHIGCHPCVPAAVGDHANPVHGTGPVAQKRCGGVGELAGAGDAMDACGAAGRVDDGAVGGERTGV